MLLVVVFGIYTWFFSSPQNAAVISAGQGQNTLNAFVVQVAEKTKTGLSKTQAYILQKAQIDWKRDPLVRIEPRKSLKKDRAANLLKSKIKYTGFLQMGDTRLAIINGLEYETGDTLEPGGYVVRKILPRHVVIGLRSANKKSMIIPMEETE